MDDMNFEDNIIFRFYKFSNIRSLPSIIVQKNRLNAFNLFILDNTLIFHIFGLVLSYTIILNQMR